MEDYAFNEFEKPENYNIGKLLKGEYLPQRNIFQNLNQERIIKLQIMLSQQKIKILMKASLQKTNYKKRIKF